MMRMVLRGIRQLEAEEFAALPEPGPGQVKAEVLACAVCRTDAKMWDQGHRDLVFPRVLGHEMVVRDQGGQIYMLWPGKSCGDCPHCRAGRENLCDDMEITGFHS
ncbi:MAG: alcohol dehydrogenase catalytic domain-containing protein, partial [Desulfobacterales bacterium]|nr:alcohol dehydrogenase catalytic domain-containing protein [Desulfobacterales bacterium]